MKRNNINFIFSICYIGIGIALNICYWLGWIDHFWSSIGWGITVVGILQTIRNIRYRTNTAYREETDTKNNDERNRFLANKAWAWAGYVYVLIAGVSIIVLKIIGQEALMTLASLSVCLLLLLYWICYMILSKRY